MRKEYRLLFPEKDQKLFEEIWNNQEQDTGTVYARYLLMIKEAQSNYRAFGAKDNKNIKDLLKATSERDIFEIVEKRRHKKCPNGRKLCYYCKVLLDDSVFRHRYYAWSVE
jgi:hypothetical protein